MSIDHPIIEDSRQRITLPAAGVTSLAVPFYFQRNGDIEVSRETTAGSLDWTVLGEAVGYTIVGAGVNAGGTVTLLAPADGARCYRVRGRTKLDRSTSVVLAGAMKGKAVDDELDRSRLIQQELRRDADDTLALQQQQKAVIQASSEAAYQSAYSAHQSELIVTAAISAGNAYLAEAIVARNQSVAARDESVTAKTDSQTARGEAVAAKNDAVTAKTDSQTARGEAVAAKNDAVAAKTASETARGEAVAAKDASVVAKAASETARDESVAHANAMAETYLGSQAANPTETSTGKPVAEGMLYWNSVANQMRAYSGDTWIVAYNPSDVAVESFNGRVGAIIPDAADYAGFYLGLGGGTLTGPLILSGTPTLVTHAANKQYVDNRCMPYTGGTFSGAVTLSADPVNALHPASKQYVDNLLNGLDPKASCRVATTANITLSGTQTIDGVAVAAGERVLVKDQTTAAQNGIYVVAAGAWSRATDMDAWLEVPGANVWIEEGTANADRAYVCTSNIGGTLGSTAINWVMYFGTGAFQSASPILTSLAGAASAAGVIAYFSGATTMAVTAFTSYGRSIVGAADAATARTVLVAEELGVTRGVVRYNASATAILADAGMVVLMNSASANTYTVPPNSSVAFKVGTYINLAQSGLGQTTIVAGSGVTVQNKYGLKLTGQWAGGQLVKIGTDEWLLLADATT
ncbi:hypothetical protein [Kaistia sp. MMO-174]|uniref:hypothetical protein n=1 Tax=Kaistia sp. MMO-174 TaxID=3081256 RepID=UPI00301AB802